MSREKEHEKLLAALQEAEKMEVDGKTFYLEMSRKSVNQRGRELFQILAEEEDVHRQDFRKIYDAVLSGLEIPGHEILSEEASKLHSLFCQAVEEVEKEIKAPAAELEAIDTAIRMEQDGIDFYLNQARKAEFPRVRRFYRELADEEKRHKATLEDYRKYAVDPAGWLVNKTIPSLGACLLPHATGDVSEIEW
ncbi:MAG: ferritin family protein [Dehalococcoidales bacterium]|jgi:rubrerythrin